MAVRGILTSLPLILAIGIVESRSIRADDALAATAAAADPSHGGVSFALDLTTADGATLTSINGRDERAEGDLIGRYAMDANASPRRSTPLVLQVTEDAAVTGPDGSPGVLRFEYVELSPLVLSSDFAVLGDEANGLITLPAWRRGETTTSDLQRTFVEFKFRSDNAFDGDRIGGLYAFRMEPERSDGKGYGRRADFGTLIATPRWRTFRRPVGSANNLEWFLTSLNEDDPQSFQLIWSQNGPIQNYAPGDSLLIDDLRIVIE